MASTLVKSSKIMRRAESKKSHSWWWDSHVSPKNSKWLAENLEDMDQSVKRMLKLIEEEGDSFAKKAEMYYQKRPELIAHVEEFYRMYRSLAERYDNVTGELRKNIPSDLQSQGSGISDVGSEPPSRLPSPDQRLTTRKSGPRAAGFEFFLGTGGSSSDLCNKEGDESSTLDSETESDDSSINNYSGISSTNGDDQGSRRKIIELEVELREVKEKLRAQQEDHSDGSYRNRRKNVDSEMLLSKIIGYEEELRVSREKIRLSEEEIAKLRSELQKNESLEYVNNLQNKIDETEKDVNQERELTEKDVNQERKLPETIDGLAEDVLESEQKIKRLEEELKITKEKLQGSEKEVSVLRHELESRGSTIQNLQGQLAAAQKDIPTWKSKVEKERREMSKLQDRIVRYKANLSDRDQEIRILKETVSNANKSLSDENSQLQAEITRLLKERSYLEDNLKEWDLRCQSLEEEVRRVKAGRTEMESLLKGEIEQLNKSLDDFKLKYDMLVAERDELNAKIASLTAEVSSKGDRIDEMSKHLHQLHVEHVELITRTERAQNSMEMLSLRIKELESEVERQQEVILEGAEEKREAIRQLCFSLEHYRNGYQQLRQAFVGHRRVPVMAT